MTAEQVYYAENMFAGKKALVVGGTGTVGKAVIEQLVKYKAEVTAIGRNEFKLAELKLKHVELHTLRVDITDDEELEAALDDFKPFELYVYCAGQTLNKGFLNIKMHHLESIFKVNYMAAFTIGQKVAQMLVNDNRPGVMVHVTSVLGNRVFRNYSALASSKSSLDQFTRSLAVEMGKHGIRANSVHPANVVSPQTDVFAKSFPNESEEEIYKKIKESIPLKKLTTPEEVANAIIFLLSERSKLVNGTTLIVDGGVTATL